MSAAADNAVQANETAAADLRALIEQLRSEVRGLSERLAALEIQQHTAAGAASARSAVDEQGAATPPVATPPSRAAEVTEEDMLAIAAAVAAFLGVRAQIRQVRLVQSAAWAQVGRATIHASHRI